MTRLANFFPVIPPPLRPRPSSWKVKAKRFLAHLIVLGLVVASAYAVVLLVERSKDVDDSSSWYRQNELTIILTLISLIYPNLFDVRRGVGGRGRGWSEA